MYICWKEKAEWEQGEHEEGKMKSEGKLLFRLNVN